MALPKFKYSKHFVPKNFPIFIGILLTLGIALAVVSVQQQQETRSRAAGTCSSYHGICFGNNATCQSEGGRPVYATGCKSGVVCCVWPTSTPTNTPTPTSNPALCKARGGFCFGLNACKAEGGYMNGDNCSGTSICCVVPTATPTFTPTPTPNGQICRNKGGICMPSRGGCTGNDGVVSGSGPSAGCSGVCCTFPGPPCGTGAATGASCVSTRPPLVGCRGTVIAGTCSGGSDYVCCRLSGNEPPATTIISESQCHSLGGICSTFNVAEGANKCSKAIPYNGIPTAYCSNGTTVCCTTGGGNGGGDGGGNGGNGGGNGGGDGGGNTSGTKLAIPKAFLHIIGKAGDSVLPGEAGGGNMDPEHEKRDIIINISDLSDNQKVTNKKETLTFDSTMGAFKGGPFDLGDLPTGSYKITIKMDISLPVTQTVTLTSGQTTSLESISLVTGDVNNDSKLDILDWNMLLDCFSDIQGAKSCDGNKKTQTDITDDNKVNHPDLNIFIRECKVNC